MKRVGYPNEAHRVNEVPDLLEQWNESKSPLSLLQARSILLDASEGLMETAAREVRGLKPEELRTLDGHMEEMRSINDKLAEYKRQRVAEITADGSPASSCRLPF